jgi:hypothetical protein
MWYEFFVVGGVFFYLLVAVVTILLILFAELERPICAGITLILTFALLALLGNFNILAAIKAHPFISLIALPGYFVAGTLWSFAKWWFYVHNEAAKYKEKKEEFLKGEKVLLMAPEEREAAWRRYLEHLQSYRSHPKPEVSENKCRILTWMIYWPWSFVWTIINDPVTKFFKFIFRKLRFVYEAIVNSAYKDVEGDFKAPEPKEKDEDEL